MSTRFDKYYQPESVKECCKLLNEYGKDAKLLAGGTDLVVRLKNGALKPQAVIGMMKIPGMNGIQIMPEGLKLGALEPLWNIERCKELEKDYQVIRESCGHVSSIQVRSIATIGGNACNASPSADAIQGLLLMDAVVNISNGESERQIPLKDFFVGPGETILADGELLLNFFIPKPEAGTGCWYEKYTIRGDSDISIIGAGARVTLDANERVSDCRIFLASVAPTPYRAVEAENILIGEILTSDKIKKAAQIAAQSIKPISDNRGSAKYRREMTNVWVAHSLEHALERAKQN